MLRCGIDMIAVARIADGHARFGERFLRRFFTDAEIAYCTQASGAAQAERLAARFAAKEAVAKALGTGIGDVGWREIEVGAHASGRPVLMLHGAAAARAEALGLREWDISLTHTGDMACAVCVAR
jgi:holo-[acyl-carrier protein] synthase